jgi:hypothetical protein
MMEATKDMPHCYYWPGEYVEKFAELIVKECAKVCSEVEDTYGNLNKIDIAVGAGVCASEIKEHFGVEE